MRTWASKHLFVDALRLVLVLVHGVLRVQGNRCHRRQALAWHQVANGSKLVKREDGVNEVEADKVPLRVMTDPWRKLIAEPERIVEQAVEKCGPVAQNGALAAEQLAPLLEFAVARYFGELLGGHTSRFGLLQIVAALKRDRLELGSLDVELGICGVLAIFDLVNDHAILRSGAVEASMLATLIEGLDLLGAMGVVGTVHFVEKWTIGLCTVAKETEIFFVAAGEGGGLMPTHCDDRVSCGKAAVGV